MIDILMAAFNGEKYIAQQIDSIRGQSFGDWRLMIRDDGSTDATLRICRDYAAQDTRIRLIDDKTAHLGVARNFIRLLDYSTAPFVMFADQDDVWLPEKVATLYAAIKEKDNRTPQALFSNAFLWNETQGIISDKNTLSYPTRLEQLLFLNSGVQGASAIFNAAMRCVLQQPLAHYAMHDHALVLAAICLGEVGYIDRPLMYYRQHGDNVSGSAPGSMRVKLRLAWQHRRIPIVDTKHYEGLKAFYEAHKSAMTTHDRATIELFLALPSKQCLSRFYWVWNRGFQLFDSTALLLAKMVVRRFSDLNR